MSLNYNDSIKKDFKAVFALKSLFALEFSLASKQLVELSLPTKALLTRQRLSIIDYPFFLHLSGQDNRFILYKNKNRDTKPMIGSPIELKMFSRFTFIL